MEFLGPASRIEGLLGNSRACIESVVRRGSIDLRAKFRPSLLFLLSHHENDLKASTLPGTVPVTPPGVVLSIVLGAFPGALLGTVPGTVPGSVPATVPATVPRAPPEHRHSDPKAQPHHPLWA